MYISNDFQWPKLKTHYKFGAKDVKGYETTWKNRLNSISNSFVMLMVYTIFRTQSGL